MDMITGITNEKLQNLHNTKLQNCLVNFTCIDSPADLMCIKTSEKSTKYAFLLVFDGIVHFAFDNTRLSAVNHCGIIHISSNGFKVETESIKALWVEFKPKAIHTLLDKRLGSYSKSVPELIKINYKKPKETLLRSLCVLSIQQLNDAGFTTGQSRACHHLEKALLNAFVDCIDRRLEQRSIDKEHQIECLERLQGWIDKHLSESIKLQDLADKAGLSRRALQKLVRKNMDCTPMDLVYFSRLMKARNLLQSPNENTSVLKVSLEVGFTHPSRFASQYQKRFHEKPSMTLKKARKLILELAK